MKQQNQHQHIREAIKQSIKFWLAIACMLSCTGSFAQNVQNKTHHLRYFRDGTVLNIQTPSGQKTAVDLEKPNLKGKVIALTYSAKKRGVGGKQYVESITIFPNPADEQVRLQLNGSWIYPVQVEILDKNGNVQQSTSLTASDEPLDIGAIAPGMYLLRASSRNASAIEKLIVQ